MLAIDKIRDRLHDVLNIYVNVSRLVCVWVVLRWRVVQENIIFGWENECSIPLRNAHERLFDWVLSLGSEVEIIKFVWRLHNNNKFAVESIEIHL